MMGALIQNINHGISTPMLFFIVGMLYDRRHTREIKEFGGLKLITPMLATMLLLATLSSIAVPFFNGFVGEFTILQGSWISLRGGFWPTALAATGMILSAVYMLWWFQRLMLGPVTRPINRHLPDLTLREWVVLTPLTAIVFWIGLFSHYWTQRMDASVDTLFIPYNQRYQLNTQMPNVDRIERAQMQKARESGQFQGMRSPMSGGRPSQSPTPPSLTTPEGTVPQTDAGAAGTESNTTTPGTPPGETGPPTESPQTPAGETGTPPGNPAGTQPGTTPGNPTGNP
jgi:NADH-quinone oxidoreductase subunit M